MRKLGLFLISAPLAAFAMGGQPSASSLHPATLVDKSGKTFRVVNLVCDDRDYFEFKEGDFTVKVPFSNVKKVEILGGKETLRVKVFLKNGKTKVLEAEPDTDCEGVNDLGNVEISLSSLKEIDFSKGE